MRLVFLLLGGILTVLFIVLSIKGKKYDYMLESFSDDDFPLKSLYSAGLALQNNEKIMKKNIIMDKLRKNCKLIYSHKYEEFYARIIFSQIITFAILSLAIGFSLGSVFAGTAGLFFAALGIICCILFSCYFYNHTTSIIDERTDKCEMEFPDAISKLALIVNSGVILHDAWNVVAFGNEGVLYDLMQKSCEEMDNGYSDVEAIKKLGVLTNSYDIKKFTTALIQSIERGGGDLPVFLTNQSSELWKLKKQYMLQKGESAASKLLLPIAIMFAGVMLIVLASALQSLSF